MSRLSNIINQLRSTGSTLEKQSILEQNKDFPELKMVFWMTEEPSLNYFMRINKHKTRIVGTKELDMETLNSIHDKILKRELTGNAARDFVHGILDQLTADDQLILIGIINRDQDCKVGTAIINKVWKKLISEMPCMLAAKMDEKVAASIVYKKDGYLVQCKLDGGRAMAIVSEDGQVQFLSRNGKPLLTHGVFDAQLSRFPGYVFDGELLVASENGVEDRQTGNGFFTKAVRNTIEYHEAIRFKYVVWDMIPVKDFYAGLSKIPYNKRLSSLINAVNTFDQTRISVVPGKVISSLEEATEYYNEMLDDGQEGAILKFIDAPWESKRSKSMIKMKEELDIDAECFAVTPHKKNPNWIGALQCRTSDGKVVFDVGSGLTEADREKDPSEFIGKIIQCKYNAVIGRRDSATKSLFLPIFQCIRFDKTQANSLEELK